MTIPTVSAIIFVMNETITITPAPGYYLVEPVDNETMGSMTISQKASFEEERGVVLAVGEPSPYEADPKTLRHPRAKVGDIIFHKTWNAEPTTYHGRHIRFIPFNDLKGIDNAKDN